MMSRSRSDEPMAWGRVVCVWVLLCVTGAQAQGVGERSAPPRREPSIIDRLARAANVWDLDHDHVYTCAEWKTYVSGLFAKADRNRDGHLDAQEFTAIQAADPQFKDAAIGYFDDDRNGRVSRAEFVDKPNPFFLRFDKDGDCRVTLEEIIAAATPAGAGRRPAGSERPR
jgi:hypothetical protein